MGGFMGYFVGGSSYEILSITDNRKLEWYSQGIHFFGIIFYDNSSRSCCIPTDYTTLKFSDEFNTDGAQILQNGAI
jgi:hypothetical protein